MFESVIKQFKTVIKKEKHNNKNTDIYILSYPSGLYNLEIMFIVKASWVAFQKCYGIQYNRLIKYLYCSMFTVHPCLLVSTSDCGHQQELCNPSLVMWKPVGLNIVFAAGVVTCSTEHSFDFSMKGKFMEGATLQETYYSTCFDV